MIFIFQRWNYVSSLLHKNFRFFCGKLIILRIFEETRKKNYIKLKIVSKNLKISLCVHITLSNIKVGEPISERSPKPLPTKCPLNEQHRCQRRVVSAANVDDSCWALISEISWRINSFAERFSKQRRLVMQMVCIDDFRYCKWRLLLIKRTKIKFDLSNLGWYLTTMGCFDGWKSGPSQTLHAFKIMQISGQLMVFHGATI